MPVTIIDIDPDQPLEQQLRPLGLPKFPPIVLLGDFDAALAPKVRAVCSRVLAALALDPGALLVDDARNSSAAALMGQAAADEDKTPPLVGIVPYGRAAADIDPNHDKIIRLPAAWQDTTKFTFQVVDQLASDFSGQAIAILFGGGAAEKQAAVRCARRDWPIVVLKGSGGLADQIVQAMTPRDDGTLPAPADPDLRRIVEDATIYATSIDAATDEINRLVLGRIAPRSESATAVIGNAWAWFNQLDEAALARQGRFRRLELWLIRLAVLAALAAILSSGTAFTAPGWDAALHSGAPGATLHLFVVAIPILISIIGAYNSYFRDGIKWILFRGAAEAVKREIFRFRAQAGVYSDAACKDTARESRLADKVREIVTGLEHSEANKTSLKPGKPGTAEQNSFLDPDQYVEARVREQSGYFEKKTRELARSLRWSQIAIFIAGGIGTLLAAFKFDVWVALATATVTALATKLQTDQVENSLVQYNQALAGLRTIELWWMALSRWEKERRKNIDLLVEQTERTLEAEMAGWVQQMQSALEKLTEKEPAAAKAASQA